VEDSRATHSQTWPMLRATSNHPEDPPCSMPFQGVPARICPLHRRFVTEMLSQTLPAGIHLPDQLDFFRSAPAFGQAKSEAARQEGANVLLRFAKDGTVTASSSGSAIIGLIRQSMLQLEGVKSVKIDAKNNGVRASYDPDKTTPQKIVVAFNKENPNTLLRASGAKEAKELCARGNDRLSQKGELK
jgi:hypothetical protein